MNRHRSLAAWKHGHDLAVAVHRAAGMLPAHQRFELGSQLRRAAASVPANIAEGSARRGAGEFAHFLSIALGSLAEVDSLLALASELDYLDAPTVEGLEALRVRTNAAVFALLHRMRSSR